MIDFFCHHDLSEVLFTSMCLVANHMMLISACDRCPNVTPNFGCHNIRKRTIFLPLGSDLFSVLNKFSVVLNVFCIFSCKRFSDIAKKYVWVLNALIGKLNFIKD